MSLITINIADQYNSLQQTPVDDSIDIINDILRNGTDLNSGPLNCSVERGWDIHFANAIEGKKPSAGTCPLIRTFSDTDIADVEGKNFEPTMNYSHIYLYFVYYCEVGLPAPFNFEKYRNAHMRRNRQLLQVSFGFDPDGKPFQFDNPQKVTSEHTNALRNLLGSEYVLPPSSGFYVSRMDLNIKAIEYKTLAM